MSPARLWRAGAQESVAFRLGLRAFVLRREARRLVSYLSDRKKSETREEEKTAAKDLSRKISRRTELTRDQEKLVIMRCQSRFGNDGSTRKRALCAPGIKVENASHRPSISSIQEEVSPGSLCVLAGFEFGAGIEHWATLPTNPAQQNATAATPYFLLEWASASDGRIHTATKRAAVAGWPLRKNPYSAREYPASSSHHHRWAGVAFFSIAPHFGLVDCGANCGIRGHCSLALAGAAIARTRRACRWLL